MRVHCNLCNQEKDLQVTLTTKQHKVFNFIKNYKVKYKKSPTYREIASNCDFKSTSNVDRYIYLLKKKNLIDVSPYTHRSIQILKEPISE
tara:strand:- start:18626 stop:18895 length:270 start_codon:yes stop_codon:yes gene_type:complete